MRIDFAQLDKQIENPPLSRPLFEQSLAAIWQNDEKNTLQRLQLQKQEYENNLINFEVKYPYEVSRSLSPQSIKKEMMYLKTKQILPSATVNYIEQKLTKRTDIKPNQSYQETQFYQTPQRHLHSYYFDNSVQLAKSKYSKQDSPSTNAKQLCTRTQKRAQMKADKMLKNTQQILAQKKRKQFDELTLRPILNYTMNSKASKEILRKRKQHFNATTNNVFQSLYNDAVRYESKRQIQRIKKREQFINQQSLRRKNKIEVFTTFEQRLLRSLENSAERKKNAHNKQEVDYSTGKKLFVPDTHLSKLTYYSHFKSTESIGEFHQRISPARDQHYAQESKKMNRSQEDITTTLNCSHQDLSQFTSKQERPEATATIPGKRLERLAELYANLIWENGVLRKQNLSHPEERVLGQFMQTLCKFEYSAAVSRQVFLALFKDYVGRINLFDKEILFRRLKKQEASLPINTSRCTFGKKKTNSSNIRAPDHNDKVFFV